MKMSIGRKLGLAFGVVLFLMLVVAILAVALLLSARATTEQLIEIQQVVDATDTAAAKLFEERVALDKFIFTGDEAGKTEFENARDAFLASWDVVKANRSDEIPELIIEVEQLSAVNHNMYASTLTYHEMELRDINDVMNLMTDADVYYEDRLKPSMENLRNDELLRAQRITANARSLSNTMIIGIIVVSVLALVIAVGAAFTISRGITTAAVQLSEATDSISRGDLDVKIEVRTGDEMEILAESIERMRISLKAAIERLRSR